MRKFPEFPEPNKAVLDQYIKHTRLKGKKDRTILGEMWQIKPFVDYFENKPLGELSKDDIETYILHRKETKSKTTVHNNIITLRSFFNWFKPGNDFFADIKTRQPKNNLPVDELVLAEDVQELREAANNQRNRAIIMLLWDSAVRSGELINTNVGNVQLDKYGAVVIVEGKTGKRRIRLIDCVPDLQLWLNMHPLRDDPKAPLFITDRKYNGKYRRLDSQTIINMLKGTAEKAGVKKNIHPHAFRHGRLTDLAKRGFNEMELRIFAGWTRESNMPATYLHLSGADIEKKILAKNGIIEDDSKEREVILKPIECPRCKTKNPVGAKYCSNCSMVLDVKTALTEGELDKGLISEMKKDPDKMAELTEIIKEIMMNM